MRLFLICLTILTAGLALLACSGEQTQAHNQSNKAASQPQPSAQPSTTQPGTQRSATLRPPSQSTTQSAAQRGDTLKPSALSKPAASTIAFEAYDLNGSLRRSSEWIGKQPVAINLWGTWCAPCRREIPDLVKVYNEYHRKGIEIIGIAVRDTQTKVRTFTQENGMGWVMLMGDANTVATMGHVTGVPTTIFLDKNGVEVARFIGPRPYEEFKRVFDSIL